MIVIHQELIPLSNKMYNSPISKDAIYTNPIIMPFIYNSTADNIMETVIYIRNDSQEHYYKDIVISLMKESGSNPIDTNGILSSPVSGSGDIVFSLNGASGLNVEQAFQYSPILSNPITLTNKYKSTYVPVVDDGIVSVKLSYGYDELSHFEWSKRKSILVIPFIGTSGMADTSYIPVRMRLTWKGDVSLFTIRDYFIDISYSSEILI